MGYKMADARPGYKMADARPARYSEAARRIASPVR